MPEMIAVLSFFDLKNRVLSKGFYKLKILFCKLNAAFGKKQLFIFL